MPTPDDHVRFVLALSRIPGVGPATYRKLVEAFGSPRAVWEAHPEALRLAVPRVADALLATRARVRPDRLLAQVVEAGCQVAAYGGPGYPAALLSVASPPLVLYLRGRAEALEGLPLVAVVGTRRASAYALRVTEKLVDGLARAGVCVVSGMARGVDEAAHRRALSSGGTTVAVLGCGVDVCYPPESRSLKAAIEANGATVSQFPPGFGPLAGNFPARNRIISGLSRAVVVVEAGLKSGAMITADFAIEQDRPLFAVPGSVLSETSAGCNRLLSEGTAVLVGDADEVLRELGLRSAERRVLASVPDETGAAVLGVLHSDDGFIDGWLELEEIVRRSGMPPSAVVRSLMRMELEGRVQRAAGNRYRAIGARP